LPKPYDTTNRPSLYYNPNDAINARVLTTKLRTVHMDNLRNSLWIKMAVHHHLLINHHHITQLLSLYQKNKEGQHIGQPDMLILQTHQYLESEETVHLWQGMYSNELGASHQEHGEV